MSNTSISSVSLSAVMLRAWDIRRAAAAAIGCKPSAVIMGACLRLAWADVDAHGAEARAASAVDTVRREWDALQPAAQLELVEKAVRRAARDVIGYSVEDEYSSYWEKPAFCAGVADLSDYHNETYVRVLAYLPALDRKNAERAAAGLAPLTLWQVCKRCAKQAVMAIYRAEVKNGRAARDYIDADGERQSIVETLCPSGDDTAREVVFAYALEQFRAKRDEIDNAIIDGLTANRTTREIGDALNMSHVAIVKRVKKIRAGMVDAGLAPASWTTKQ